ncbi:MAG: endonuclease/exonuclease/phosphatase family protein, partial [Candidatus Heimdallarchaeota archaeon]
VHNKWILGWIGLYIISLIDLLWIDLLPFVTYFLVQVSACFILFSGLKSSSIPSFRSMGIRMAGVQLLLVLTLFLQVSAGNWAFMPSILEFTRGQAATMIFLAGLFLPLSSLEINLPKYEVERPQNLKNSFRIICLMIIVISTGGIIFYEVLTPVRDPDTTHLKVMNFNIHQYFSIAQTGLYNLEQVRDVILDSQADVVGLQESEGSRITSSNMNGVQWLVRQTGMKYYYYGPPTSAQIYGVSLLSRYPILNPRYVDLPAEQSIERVAIVAEIETGTLAGQLPVIVTHFQTNRYSEDRLAQAQTIVSISENFEKALILGDFNTRPNGTDPTFTLLNSSFSDAWIHAGNDPSEGATSYSDDGVAIHRIDYIWMKGSWTVLRCETFGSTRTSDHRAVYAELLPN